MVFSARRPSGSSPTQYSSPPNKPSSKSKPRTAKQKEPSSPQKEPRSSTPRRGARERRSWDPERVYGNRVSEEHSHPSRVDKPVSKQLSKTRVAEGVSKAQKSKEKTRQAQPKADADDSLREGSSRSRRATEAAGDTTKPRRRGRPKLSDSQVPGTEPQQSTSRAPRRKMSSTVQQKPEQEPQEPPTKRRKRKAPQTEAEPEAEQEPRSDSEDEHISFRHLKESVRNIERAIVDSKWERLDAPSIGAVASILAEAQRPVLLRLQTTNQRREHASAALSHVSRRLVNKLGRGLPFPAPIIVPSARANSGSHMEDFDFERTVDTIQNLENTLNPLLHSVTLLEKEIKKEEGALNKEYESLHRLEANARSKAAEWRDKTRREHPLVPDVQIKAENDNKTGNDVLELVPIIEGDVIGGVFQVGTPDYRFLPAKNRNSKSSLQGLEDEELVGLSKQIGSHMESMKGNLQQIGGVVPAINRSKAALRQVLTKHLKEEKYSSVLLG